MAYEGGKGRGKPGGFGGKKPYAKREGGYGEKRPYARKEGGYDGEKRPYRARAEGGEGGEKRPYAPRSGGGYGEKRPYQKREGGYDRKPREGGFDGEKRPYRARNEGGEFAEKRPYAKREGGFGEKRPYQKREGGVDRAPREGGYEKRPYAKREGGLGEKRPYQKREGGYERKPREEFGARQERFEGAEGREFAPRRGEGKTARFDGKREIKRDREVVALAAGDGWLVGYHAVVAALKIGRRSVRKIWLLGEAQDELAGLIAAHPEWEVETRAKPDFEKEFGDAVHQGVAALVGNLPQPSLPELIAAKPKLIVALDQVTDPHNLGAIVRSCAAFGAGGVIVTEYRAAGLSATAAKAAAGALETVPVVEVVNLVQSIEMLKEARFTVIGLAGEATVEIGEISEKGPVCLVVGSEGDGLRRLTREHCDVLAKIAISDTVESLNVSVATGVALAVLSRK